MTNDEFQSIVWQKSRELYREMPWRDEPTFYHVLVSELMLQQTQVSRVLSKFQEFMHEFPDVSSLAHASLADVLKIWSGLGYNRRAKFLHEAAKEIAKKGEPRTVDELIALPGIGKNTAAAMMNYVYEIPTPFVETNIRTVYFKHFFVDRQNVTDKEVREKVEQTIDREHPREWFWALMDYGAWLKTQGEGRLDVSRHYKKQAPLKGSLREMRGWVLRELSTGSLTKAELRRRVGDDDRLDRALRGLSRDGLIDVSGEQVHLTK